MVTDLCHLYQMWLFLTLMCFSIVVVYIVDVHAVVCVSALVCSSLLSSLAYVQFVSMFARAQILLCQFCDKHCLGHKS